MELFGLGVMEILIRLVLGLVIGFFIGLTGVGGGVLVLPALTLILKIPPVAAVGTASLYAFLTKVYATFRHIRLKTIVWPTCISFLVGAVPANIVVSLWISSKGSNEQFQNGLRQFIVGVVFLSVILMLFNLLHKKKVPMAGAADSEGANQKRIMRTLLGVFLGSIIGALIGATSIGGGVLIVPMLIMIFHLRTSETVGSSIFIAVVLTLVTSLIYGKGGEIDKNTAIIMAAGSLLGVYYGSKFSVKMPDRLLKIIVICIIFVAAVLMLLKQGH